MNIFKKIFGKTNKEQVSQTTTQQYTNKFNNRLLKLANDDCALVFHPNGKLQVIFTKFYDNNTQQITPQEQTLMAIAIFLKQPGFSQLLRTEFNNIAIKNFKMLADNDKGENNE